MEVNVTLLVINEKVAKNVIRKQILKKCTVYCIGQNNSHTKNPGYWLIILVKHFSLSHWHKQIFPSQ